MRPTRILVIDDDAGFLAHLSQFLTSRGFEVVQAADGPTAIRILERRAAEIDLAIIDLVLPGNVSGLDVILAVTRKRIPMKIVATSAVWSPTQLEMVKYAGADAVLPKSPSPVHFSESQWLACIRAQIPAEGTPAAN
ncbi:MAG TPA: response regulator [Bryobacteraceae bacterium]|nr:response regulator [Bryobacteraceae bacterium]